MGTMSLDQVYELVTQLSEFERRLLVERLQSATKTPPQITRESLIAELEHRRAAGLFDHTESLRNKYAALPLELSDDELRASIHEIANEWESDINGLFDD